MREKYTQTIKLYCLITNTKIVVHIMKYDLSKICCNCAVLPLLLQCVIQCLKKYTDRTFKNIYDKNGCLNKKIGC